MNKSKKIPPKRAKKRGIIESVTGNLEYESQVPDFIIRAQRNRKAVERYHIKKYGNYILI